MKINLDSFKDKNTLYPFLAIIFLFILGWIIGKILFFDDIGNMKKKLNIQKNYLLEIGDFQNQINDLNLRLGPLKEEQESLSRLFHNKNEIENLYQELSTIAIRNGLTIVNLEKLEKETYDIQGNKITEEQSSDNDTFYMIPVDYTIIGNFIDYLRFRAQVAELQKSLNFQSELISLSEDVDRVGEINSTATIAVFSLEGE